MNLITSPICFALRTPVFLCAKLKNACWNSDIFFSDTKSAMMSHREMKATEDRQTERELRRRRGKKI